MILASELLSFAKVTLFKDDKITCTCCGSRKDREAYYIRRSARKHKTSGLLRPEGLVIQPCKECKKLYERKKRNDRS